jgi:hypothetical protein
MRTWHFPPTGFGRSISLGVAMRVGVLLFLAAGVVLLAELPPFIEFGVAVMAAVCWTVFLDRYWTGARPEPTPDGGGRMSMPLRTSLPLIAIRRPPARSHESTKAA